MIKFSISEVWGMALSFLCCMKIQGGWWGSRKWGIRALIRSSCFVRSVSWCSFCSRFLLPRLAEPWHQPAKAQTLYFISVPYNITIMKAEFYLFSRIVQGHHPLRCELGSDPKVHVFPQAERWAVKREGALAGGLVIGGEGEGGKPWC